MLFLLMRLDGDRYAIDIAQVAEVLPLVQLRPLARAPAGVAGILDYGGAPVPVLDLSLLLVNRPAHRRLSTRLVIVHYARRRRHLLALIAEHATEIVRRDPRTSGRGVSPRRRRNSARLARPAGSVHGWTSPHCSAIADSLFKYQARDAALKIELC
jgi:hypothetical protein